MKFGGTSVADLERIRRVARLVAAEVATGKKVAVVGAEYVLRWLPPGTHDWKKFIKPHEMMGFLAHEPVSIAGPFGVSYDVLTGRWSPSSDVDVNYMMTVDRSAGS